MQITACYTAKLIYLLKNLGPLTVEHIGSQAAYSQGSTSAGETAQDNSGTLPRISVVIPCYNEIDSLDRLSEGLHDLETEIGPDRACFILVDDGSSDGTVEGLENRFGDRTNFRILRHEQNRGISAAIRTGITAATTEIVCSMDSDCSYDPLQLVAMIPLLTDGVELITASPYHPQGQVLNVPAWRLWISQIASRMYRLVLKVNLHTYTSCFRIYRRSTFSRLDFTEDGFVGVAEVVWRYDQVGARIIEQPATLDIRQFGQSKMRVVEVTRDHLKLMSRIAMWRLGSLFGMARSPQQVGTTQSTV